MPWPDMAARMLGVAVRTFSHSGPDGAPLVQYIPRTGSPYPIRGVFDKAYISVDTSGEAPVSSTTPVLGVELPLRDASTGAIKGQPAKGDRVQVGPDTYVVDDCQPDGTAGALLKLYEA